MFLFWDRFNTLCIGHFKRVYNWAERYCFWKETMTTPTFFCHLKSWLLRADYHAFNVDRLACFRCYVFFIVGKLNKFSTRKLSRSPHFPVTSHLPTQVETWGVSWCGHLLSRVLGCQVSRPAKFNPVPQGFHRRPVVWKARLASKGDIFAGHVSGSLKNYQWTSLGFFSSRRVHPSSKVT